MKRSSDNLNRLEALARLYDEALDPASEADPVDGTGDSITDRVSPSDPDAGKAAAEIAREEKALAEVKFVLDHDMPRRPDVRMIDLIAAEAARAHRSSAAESGAAAAASAAARTNGRAFSGDLRLLFLPQRPIFRYAAAACLVLLVGLVGMLSLRETGVAPSLEAAKDELLAAPTDAFEIESEKSGPLDTPKSVASGGVQTPPSPAPSLARRDVGAVGERVTEGAARPLTGLARNRPDRAGRLAPAQEAAPRAEDFADADGAAFGNRAAAPGMVLAGSLSADAPIPPTLIIWDDVGGVYRVRRRIEQLEANTFDLNWDNAVVPLEMPPAAGEGASGRRLIRENRRDN